MPDTETRQVDFGDNVAEKRKAPTSRGFSLHQLLEARAGVEPA
jgi:hypothetical protein